MNLKYLFCILSLTYISTGSAATTGKTIPSSTGKTIPSSTGKTIPSSTGKTIPSSTGKTIPSSTIIKTTNTLPSKNGEFYYVTVTEPYKQTITVPSSLKVAASQCGRRTCKVPPPFTGKGSCSGWSTTKMIKPYELITMISKGDVLQTMCEYYGIPATKTIPSVEFYTTTTVTEPYETVLSVPNNVEAITSACQRKTCKMLQTNGVASIGPCTQNFVNPPAEPFKYYGSIKRGDDVKQTTCYYYIKTSDIDTSTTTTSTKTIPNITSTTSTTTKTIPSSISTTTTTKTIPSSTSTTTTTKTIPSSTSTTTTTKTIPLSTSTSEFYYFTVTEPYKQTITVPSSLKVATSQCGKRTCKVPPPFTGKGSCSGWSTTKMVKPYELITMISKGDVLQTMCEYYGIPATKTIPNITSTTPIISTTNPTKCIPVTITVTETEKDTITVKETVTVTIKSDPTNDPIDETHCAAKWAQCGGVGYKGPTCCQSGSTCRELNQYYSQCV